jgi:hypothetical protein
MVNGQLVNHTYKLEMLYELLKVALNRKGTRTCRLHRRSQTVPRCGMPSKSCRIRSPNHENTETGEIT